ncbi:MAG: hypothetical protein FWG89_07865 [Treponema sp.]|nr:hypothetical protein [Treponema sp.]
MIITAKKQCVIGLVILLTGSAMMIDCTGKEEPAEAIQLNNNELITGLQAEIEAAQTELSELFSVAVAMLSDPEMWQQRLRGGRPERRERQASSDEDDAEGPDRESRSERRRFPGNEAVMELLEVLSESGQVLEGELAILTTMLDDARIRLETAQEALIQALSAEQAEN